MGVLRIVVLCTFLAYICRLLYMEPVPHGVVQPYLTKSILAGSRMLHHMAWALDQLGIVRDFTSRRLHVNVLTALTNRDVPGVKKEDAVFDGVPVRIYVPEGHKENGAGLLFFHGGGWMIGNIDTYDSMPAFMAKAGDIVVVSVEYRLNPEYSHNDGLDDCVRATKHVIRNAPTYGLDPRRIAVSGDSAGGNYAAVVALVLRDEGFHPPLKQQVLIYPSTQTMDFMLPSFQQNARGPFITITEFSWVKSYLSFKNNKYTFYFESNTHVPCDVKRTLSVGVLNHDIIPEVNKYAPYSSPICGEGDSEVWDVVKIRSLDPYHYPLMAETHNNLPQTYIFTGQYDILRDDGYLYAHKLKKDGGNVTHYNCMNCWHGMFNFLEPLEHPKEELTKIMTFIKNTL